MPTVFRYGPYRFFFYSSDGVEPLHIHVEREQMIAKFWINPVRLQLSGGFNRSELMVIQKLVEENAATISGVWNDYFGN